MFGATSGDLVNKAVTTITARHKTVGLWLRRNIWRKIFTTDAHGSEGAPASACKPSIFLAEFSFARPDKGGGFDRRHAAPRRRKSLLPSVSSTRELSRQYLLALTISTLCLEPLAVTSSTAGACHANHGYTVKNESNNSSHRLQMGHLCLPLHRTPETD